MLYSALNLLNFRAIENGLKLVLAPREILCSAIQQKLWQAGQEQNIVQLSCVAGNFAELGS